MDFDLNGLEVLERGACLDLLRTVPIGRIGLTQHALPVVLPVNFVLDRDEIVVRTAAGTKLSAAMAGAVVAFEADDYDSVGHGGWSVLVQGTSRVLRDPEELERAAELRLRPWANDATDWYLAISTDLVSGRRVRHWGRDGAHRAFVSAALGGDGHPEAPGDRADGYDERDGRRAAGDGSWPGMVSPAASADPLLRIDDSPFGLR